MSPLPDAHHGNPTLAGAREPEIIGPWLLRSPVHEWATVLLLVVFVRLPSIPPSVIDWDESLYILGARSLLHGQLPYVAVFDDKPLGAPALIAAAMTVLGSSVPTVRLLGCLGVAATALLLGRLAALLGLPRTSGPAAAVLYAAFSTRLGGLATNTELLFAPFAVAALCVAATGWDARRWLDQAWRIIGIGLLFGIAIWIKYVAAVPAAVAFATLAGAWLWRSRAGAAGAAGLAALYAAACALPTAVTAVGYLAAGQLGAFWHCNFGYMRAFLAISLSPGFMIATAAESLLAIWPLLLLGALGIWFGWRGREVTPPRAAAAVLALWMTAEALAVAAPWKFYSHYFLVLLPPLALLSGTALSAIAERAVLPHLRPAAPWALAGIAALVPLTAVAGKLAHGWPNLAGPDMPRQVAKAIRGDPAPTAWVVNSQPIIYFLAGIPAPTRFPFPPHLVGWESALTGTDPLAEIERILAERPRFLVVDESRWDAVTPEAAALVRAALVRDYVRVANVREGPASVDVFRLSPATSSPAAVGR